MEKELNPEIAAQMVKTARNDSGSIVGVLINKLEKEYFDGEVKLCQNNYEGQKVNAHAEEVILSIMRQLGIDADHAAWAARILCNEKLHDYGWIE